MVIPCHVPLKEIKEHTGIFLISPLSALFLYRRKVVYKSAPRAIYGNGQSGIEWVVCFECTRAIKWGQNMSEHSVLLDIRKTRFTIK